MAAFRPKRSVHIHRFDSASYPPFYHTTRNLDSASQTQKLEPKVYACG